MESIGEKLKSAREGKKLSITDVVKDTNINPVYLNALEDEDFDKFPSETYLIGFLRSYAEYLKLDTEDIIESYKGYKIGESVTPLEELTKPTAPSFGMVLSNALSKVKGSTYFAIIGILVVLVIVGVKYMFSSSVDINESNSVNDMKKEYNTKNSGSDISNVRILQLQKEKGFILVYRNEAVQFMVGNKEVVFLLESIKEKTVSIEVLPGNKELTLKMGAPISVQLENIPREVVFTLKGLTDNRANIWITLGKQLEVKDEKISENPEGEKKDNTKVTAKDNRNLKIVLEVEFKQKSFVEIYTDGQKKARGFIPAGRKERWEASEYIQLKVGNAGGVKAVINNKPYVLGKAGQVAHKVITWKKDINNPTLYHIVVKDW